MEKELRDIVKDLREMKIWGRADITGPVRDGFNHIADRIEAALAEKPAERPRNLTDHQQAVEEAAGMPIDWGMANASQVAAVPASVQGSGERDEAPMGRSEFDKLKAQKDAIIEREREAIRQSAREPLLLAMKNALYAQTNEETDEILEQVLIENNWGVSDSASPAKEQP